MTEEKQTCYDCKYIECIPYTPLDYCISRGKWIQDPSKLCKKFEEEDGKSETMFNEGV